MTGKKLLHQRAYEVDAYVEDDQHMRLIGTMRDVRPDGLWGIVDIEPLILHDMRIELVVSATTFTITTVETSMLTHPQDFCPVILPIFQQLVGVSIARGFGNKVKELFGGPRSCTHFVSLLNAMAPVIMQARWAFFSDTNAAALEALADDPAARAEMRSRGHEMNRDTCHVWATNGPMFTSLESGAPFDAPLWAKKRLDERGIPVDSWNAL
jgi:Protein of unknown function (DUF2889)